MDAESTHKYYFHIEERLDAEIYNNSTASQMRTPPVLALATEGGDAVAKVRKIIGSTYPNAAEPRRCARTLPTRPRRHPR